MASLAMENSIRLSSLLGWDYDSKSSVALNIDSCGCSCTFLDGGQIMSIGVTVVVLFVFVFVVVVVVLLWLCCCFVFTALLLGSLL
jgi:hypothetical protein